MKLGEPSIAKILPWEFRILAWYFGVFRRLSIGRVLGGSFLQRRCIEAMKLSRRDGFVDLPFERFKARIDLYDYRSLNAMDEMDAGESRWLSESGLLRPGDSFIDVGANHGAYGLNARVSVGVDGEVLCIEPLPRLAASIRRSGELNSFDNLEVLNIAASDRNEECSLFVPDSGSGSSSLHKKYNDGDVSVVDVRAETIDTAVDWASLPGEILMKIDVEGNELQVIEGASEMLLKRKPTIFLEINEASATAAGYTVPELIQVLKKYGYSLFSDVASYPEFCSLDGLNSVPQRNVLLA